MRILVIDNYDSFTYNLVHYIMDISEYPVEVFRNDEITLEAVDTYDFIILSPGPGLPSEAGIMPQLIQTYAARKSIFGVCLGLQAIGEAFGGQLENLERVYHGVATDVKVLKEDDPLFKEIPNPFPAGRYHSWIIKQDHFPKDLEVTAVDDKGSIMAARHREYHVAGVQFHPESIMTTHGKQMLRNFLTEVENKLQLNTTTTTSSL